MGKAYISSVVFSRLKVSKGLLLASLKKEKYFLKTHMPHSWDALRKQASFNNHSEKFATCLGQYLGKHKYAPPITITQRNQEIKKFITKAKQFRRHLHTERMMAPMWAMCDIYRAKPGQIGSAIQHYFDRRLIAIDPLFEELDDIYEDCKLSTESAYLLNLIADLDSNDFLKRLDKEYVEETDFNWRKRPDFPDPYLYELVSDAIPIWCSLTGRTYQETNFADERGDKKHPFAEWLIDACISAQTNTEKKLVIKPTANAICDMARKIKNKKISSLPSI